MRRNCWRLASCEQDCDPSPCSSLSLTFLPLSLKTARFHLQLSLSMLVPMCMGPDRLTAFPRGYYQESYRKVGICYPLDACA